MYTGFGQPGSPGVRTRQVVGARVRKGVGVGWLGGEDRVDLRTSIRLTHPVYFGILSGYIGLGPAQGIDSGAEV